MIVVFNCGRIESLTSNMAKIGGFRHGLDTLVVYDCSEDADDQLRLLRIFCEENAFKLDKDIHFRRRSNWGLAEGGRVDFSEELRSMTCRPDYLLQFQDHYLDTTSVYSVWPSGTKDLDGNDVAGQVKGDCIRNNHRIDLDEYADILKGGIADVLYSSHYGIGLFPYWSEVFFCIDGVNFASTTDTYLRIFDGETCAKLVGAHDNSYQWALFAEHYIGLRIKTLGLKMRDTYLNITFRDTPDILKAMGKEFASADMLHVSETYYGFLFYEYMEKLKDQ
jgi:hypothetical protein